MSCHGMLHSLVRDLNVAHFYLKNSLSYSSLHSHDDASEPLAYPDCRWPHADGSNTACPHQPAGLSHGEDKHTWHTILIAWRSYFFILYLPLHPCLPSLTPSPTSPPTLPPLQAQQMTMQAMSLSQQQTLEEQRKQEEKRKKDEQRQKEQEKKQEEERSRRRESKRRSRERSPSPRSPSPPPAQHKAPAPKPTAQYRKPAPEVFQYIIYIFVVHSIAAFLPILFYFFFYAWLFIAVFHIFLHCPSCPYLCSGLYPPIWLLFPFCASVSQFPRGNYFYFVPSVLKLNADEALYFLYFLLACRCLHHLNIFLLPTNYMKDQNQQCVSPPLHTFRVPCSVCGSQPQAHWFLLRTVIFKNSSQIYSFICF